MLRKTQETLAILENFVLAHIRLDFQSLLPSTRAILPGNVKLLLRTREAPGFLTKSLSRMSDKGGGGGSNHCSCL